MKVQVFESDGDKFRISHVYSIKSTNDTAKLLARSGINDRFVLLANKQTKGRGRFDRKFYSPSSGLYFSLVLRPASLEVLNSITPLTAVALSKAIDDITKKDTRIKWVNDIYLDGKKTAGILCESEFNNDGTINFVVVGVGVNTFTPRFGFNKEIKDKAVACMDGFKIGKYLLFLHFLDIFNKLYKNFDKEELLKEYKNRSCILGRQVNVVKDNAELRLARVLDIDNDFRLLVRYFDDDSEEVLSTGEVSLVI